MSQNKRGAVATRCVQARTLQTFAFHFSPAILILSLVLCGAADSLSARRQRLEAMSPAQKSALAENRDRLLLLDARDQEQLRKLDAELNRDPRADELRRTMVGYYAWLKSLSSAERLELSQLQPAERAGRVKELYQQQQTRLAMQLELEDVPAIVRWVEEAVLKRMPEAERNRYQGALPRERRQMIVRGMRRRLQVEPPTVEEIAALHSQLSAAGQARLDAQEGHDKKLALVRHWVVEAPQLVMRRPQDGKNVLPDTAEFPRFLQSLPPQVRRELESLEPEERARRMRELWNQKRGLPSDGPAATDRPTGSDQRPPGARPGGPKRPKGQGGREGGREGGRRKAEG